MYNTPAFLLSIKYFNVYLVLDTLLNGVLDNLPHSVETGRPEGLSLESGFVSQILSEIFNLGPPFVGFTVPFVAVVFRSGKEGAS